MDKKGIAFIIYLIVVAVVLVCLVCTKPKETKETKQQETEIEVVQEGDEQELPDTITEEFIKIIYEYDTSERKYFEGADEYMTTEAYEKFIPLPADEDVGEVYFHMQSEIQSYQLYKRVISDEQVEFVAEIYFTVSGSGEYSQCHIVKLCLENDEGWLITSCDVLTTEGE